MTDPKRLSEGFSEETALEASLLRAARKVGIGDSDKRQIWASVSSALSLAALPAAASGATKASASTSALGVGKALLMTTTVLALGAGGYALFYPQPASQARAPSAASLPLQASTAATGSAPATATLPSASASSPPVVLAPQKSASGTGALSPSWLREESAGIVEARQALRSGNFALTLSRLEQLRARFPHGALAQEREALTIETLGRSGAGAEARRRARAFLSNYPKSPYASTVERYARP